MAKTAILLTNLGSPDSPSVADAPPAPPASPALTLWPNPVKDALHIRLETQTFPLDYDILDMSGRIVARGQMFHTEETIGTAGLQDGVYFIRIRHGGRHVAAGRFVKAG